MKAQILAIVTFICMAFAVDPHYTIQAHIRRSEDASDSDSSDDEAIDVPRSWLAPLVKRKRFNPKVHINCNEMCTDGATWYNFEACKDICPKSRDKNDCDQSLRKAKADALLKHYLPTTHAAKVHHVCFLSEIRGGSFRECIQSFIDQKMPELKGWKHSKQCHDPNAVNTRKGVKPYWFGGLALKMRKPHHKKPEQQSEDGNQSESDYAPREEKE